MRRLSRLRLHIRCCVSRFKGRNVIGHLRSSSYLRLSLSDGEPATRYFVTVARSYCPRTIADEPNGGIVRGKRGCPSNGRGLFSSSRPPIIAHRFYIGACSFQFVDTVNDRRYCFRPYVYSCLDVRNACSSEVASIVSTAMMSGRLNGDDSRGGGGVLLPLATI